MPNTYERIPTRGSIQNPSYVALRNGKPLDPYETNDVDKISSTFLYNGLEEKDGNWCVETVDSSNGVSLRYATAINNPSYTTYATAWASRVSLTYDLFSVAF